MSLRGAAPANLTGQNEWVACKMTGSFPFEICRGSSIRLGGGSPLSVGYDRICIGAREAELSRGFIDVAAVAC